MGKDLQLELFEASKFGTSNINDEIIKKLDNYTLDLYIEDLKKNGLSETWNNICQYVLSYGENESMIKVDNFGELYEIGLAFQDKIQKKKSGQYYTPEDVASVMSKWLIDCSEDNVCDVACGTGKLILTYLELLGNNKAKKLINSGKIYLYDYDKVALSICKTSIIVRYGITKYDVIHDIWCDFLDSNIILPDNAKVISNPPYAKIEKINECWDRTPVLIDTKEYYSVFMEKIFNQAKSTVIITPFSFISGNKFYSLRKKMSELGNGFVVSFDNVPGNIFCGRKHGIFNTNTSNSVRAAITVLHKDKDIKGFRISPLIRFKNEERDRLLVPDVLTSTLSDYVQVVDDKNKTFKKISKNLTSIYDKWVEESDIRLKDIISKEETKYLLDIPNTCRYYTTGSSYKLNRNGSNQIYLKDEDEYNFIYCLINSSFTYWWWRIYDGGITYPVGLLNDLPVPIKLLTSEDKKFFKELADEMKKKEKDYIVTKVNAGVKQENIKFPDIYRKKINTKILNMLGFNVQDSVFDIVHSNKFFEEE